MNVGRRERACSPVPRLARGAASGNVEAVSFAKTRTPPRGDMEGRALGNPLAVFQGRQNEGSA
jgi:hypothetical protein